MSANRLLIRRPLLLLFGIPAIAVALAFLYLSPGTRQDLDFAQPVFAGENIQGDVDCSGNAQAIDGVHLLRHAIGLSSSAAACLSIAGDVDCSGAIDAMDALKVVRYAAGVPASTPSGCIAIGATVTAQPNSYQLIQEALDAGGIDDETALVYKIYATFSDHRLPGQYQGDDSRTWDDPGAVAQAVATFDSLSSETQDILRPFLIPAYAPGSWQALAATQGNDEAHPQAEPQYFTIDSSPHVKIWYREDRPQDEATAQSLADEVDNKIWGMLTGLMGDPKDDSAEPNNGGDGRIDIILSGGPVRSFAAPFKCKATSANITLGTAGTDKWILTHELMHVVTFHFNVKNACEFPEYRWFNEATSEWAMDYVYPSDDKERGAGDWIPPCFLNHPDNQPLEYRNDCHEYAAYLFAFYISHTYNASYIRSIWDSFASNDSLAAINAALAPVGGLKKVWPDFTVENYNRGPDTVYSDDRYDKGAKLAADDQADLGGQVRRKYVMLGDVDHLSSYYFSYEFTDNNIKEVAFRHSLKDQSTAHVKVLILYQGALDWVVEDWTPFSEKKFCYDDDGQQKFEKLVFVISNSEYQNRSAVLQSDPQPELEISNSCGAVGTAHAHYLYTEGYREEWDVVANIKWIEDPDFFFGCNCRVFFPEGDINWTWDFKYDDPTCNDHDSGHLLAGQGLDYKEEQMLILWNDPQDPDQYIYSVSGGVPAAWYSDCEDGDREGLDFLELPVPEEIDTSTPTFPPTAPAHLPAALQQCETGHFTIPKNATTISGSCVDQTGDLTYDWNFAYSAIP